MVKKNSKLTSTTAVFITDDHLSWSNSKEDGQSVQEFSWHFMHAGSQHKALDLYISSGGGSATAMNQIHDLIRAVSAEVNVIAMGMVCSAAFYLTVTAPKGRRKAFASTMFMWHEAASRIGNGHRNIRNYMGFSDEEETRMRDRIIECSKLTATKYDKLFNGDDVYMSAQDALHYGLIDEIIDHIDPVPFDQTRQDKGESSTE
jgi:ATP-dependent Clp protease protease subunit